jgi:hypothetical protein
MQPVPLEIGDVLVRHPWGLHRGTPNMTGTPRPLVTVRYVRRWYADHSREVNSIPRGVWRSLTPEQQGLLRSPSGTSLGRGVLILGAFAGKLRGPARIAWDNKGRVQSA